MADWDKKLLWGFMFLLAGAVGQSVNYPPPVCAVAGSTLTLPCTFTQSKTFRDADKEVRIKIVRVRWCQNHEICQGSTPSVYDSDSPNINPRYRYLGDLEGSCTLQITDVNREDEATLRFRMEVNHTTGHFTGVLGVSVTVREQTQMEIKSSSGDRQMTKGETVTLHCTARCTFHRLKVTWFKDGHALLESSPALHLGPLTAEDSGNYTCALETKQGTESLPYGLDVKAGEEEEGRDVNVPLIVGVVFGVLLALFTLIMVLCIIRRKRAADNQRAAGGEGEQKHLDNIYSNILLNSDLQRGGQLQETSQAVEDVSYASVQFQHKNQDRAAEQEEAVIYSSVASRG
uniref:uncharacterized protein n=1 Tax=Semicossyphus pulcher TaxID=241346 RepID=UPI0037E97612